MNKHFKNFVIFSTGAVVGFATCGAIVTKKAINHGYLQVLVSRKNEKVCDEKLFVEGQRTSFTFDSRSSAEKVLDDLNDLMKKYGMVSVADVYDLAGEWVPYTANRYGWTNLDTASVVRVRHGYELRLPKTIRINNL